MHSHDEDPRITAYLVNELEPEARQAFEQELADNPELAAEVNAMRDLFGELDVALADEPCPQLSDADRQAVFAASEASPSTAKRPRAMLVPILAVAACAAIAGTVLWPKQAPGIHGEQIAATPSQTAVTPAANYRPDSASEARNADTTYPVNDELSEELREVAPESTPPGKLTDAAKKPLPEMPAPPAASTPAPGESRKRTEGERRKQDWQNHLYVDGHVRGAAAPVDNETNANPTVARDARFGDAKDDLVAGRLIKNREVLDGTAITSEMTVSGTVTLQRQQAPAAVVNQPAPPAPGLPQTEAPNREAYKHLPENDYRSVEQHPLSTFSIDVDTASYANVRRFLNQGQLPPKDAVRIEEMINYFNYQYPEPEGDAPFSVGVDLVGCPWNAKHRLARIGLKGKTFKDEVAPAANLVFLIDVSGSMSSSNKLPLLVDGLKMLADNLREDDTVAITVYAGSAGMVLEPTSDREAIKAALGRLKAGGSTNGASGIHLAYQVAQKQFIKGGANRVILATDGDFNVGTTSEGDLVRLIKEKAKSGVFLTVLGFGQGNYQDSRLEAIANKGNGNYAYVDSKKEAHKVLIEQMNGTLHTIAKDVKIQVEFNPAQVAGYRLLGYENRMLKKEDFNDDKKDAGEIGAGHTVTALYEIIPVSVAPQVAAVDPLRYQPRPDSAKPTAAIGTTPEVAHESLTVKLRYKQPDGDVSSLITKPVVDQEKSYADASPDLKFAAAVAAFGMLLRDSEHKANSTFEGVIELAEEGADHDPRGYRAEFIKLARQAQQLSNRR